MGREVAGSGHRITRILAYTAVYVLWGGSFLAVREIVVAAPPFLAASVRFLIAGLVLIVWGRAIRAPIPTRREIGSTALLGLILFAINYACLFWAEQRVASGYAAVISATVPVWVFAGEWLVLRAFRPSAAAITGMVFGISGVALLVLPGSGGEWTFAALALLVGAICWAGGTLLSLRIPMPRSRHVSAGLQMWFGGLMLLVLSAVSGDLWRFGETARIWNLRLTFDMAYLIGAASIAAFLAYLWLIDHEPSGSVASYAYVNPLIAVVLGAVVAGERLAPAQIAGGALVLAGVVVTLRFRRA